MKRAIGSLFVLTFASVAFFAQSVKVGDQVQYQCFCLGREWVRATVEAVSGGNVRVRFGNMDNQVITLPMNSPKLQLPTGSAPGQGGGAGGEFRADNMQQQFAGEAAPKYRKVVEQFAHFYDPKYNSAGGPVRPEQWQQAVSQLAELDSLCRTRYAGVKDFQGITYIKDGSVDYRFAVWCDIAAKRQQLEPIARSGMARTLVNLGYTDENLNFGFNEPDNPIRMETQQLIWERDKWRAEKIAWLTPKYAEYGAAVPADATSAVEKRADQLRDLALAGAPNRSYKQPANRDAAVETFMKAKFVKEYPGAQVVKIGTEYATWVQRKSLTYVASDELFRYYKVDYNTYKRGTALLKIPGRPMCQTQDWVVGRSAKGLVAVAVGGSGVFMRCD